MDLCFFILVFTLLVHSLLFCLPNILLAAQWRVSVTSNILDRNHQKLFIPFSYNCCQTLKSSVYKIVYKGTRAVNVISIHYLSCSLIYYSWIGYPYRTSMIETYHYWTYLLINYVMQSNGSYSSPHFNVLFLIENISVNLYNKLYQLL